MENHTSIDDLLADEEPVTEPDTTPERPRDENGRFAAKDTGVEEPAPEPEASEPPSDKLPPETFKGLKEERTKRQAIEAELEALKQQLQAIQNPPQPQAPPPDIWEDTEGWQSHLANNVTAQASLNARLDMSEMLASQAHEDFEPMKAKFIQMMQLNPALQAQALEAKHPWEKAYQIAKNAATMEELGATDLETLKAKLREELAAEMQMQPSAPAIPQSLTTARNVAPRSGPTWSGPRSLDDLLG